MKTTKIIYWASTGIVSLMMCLSAWMYLTKPEIKEAFHVLGFPDYFRVELAVAKIVGAALLLMPVWQRLKEWVYAGFGIVFISAFVAHLSSGVAVSSGVMAIVFLLLLGVSYVMYHKQRVVRVV